MKKQVASKTTTAKQPSGISILQAREKFGELVNRASLLSERVYVTKHGKPVAALVSVEDAKLLEALEDRYDLDAVKAARADIAKHGTVPFEDLAKELGL
ncbi:MAG TPA: type II toxin-antitoxin system Phd/YefM family antitoxin [Gammaproteobacteria bacterium]|nr:type II toxin-antitoxin system Phd/YefM family antitoxin [Gammaproteobacteria bacterium]